MVPLSRLGEAAQTLGVAAQSGSWGYGFAVSLMSFKASCTGVQDILNQMVDYYGLIG